MFKLQPPFSLQRSNFATPLSQHSHSSTEENLMIYNFNSGPSVLPKEVFEEASKAILNFNNSGLSILEIGHRTSLFQAVLDEAVALSKELMQLDDQHEVLFLHGGASTQFFQIPMNLLNENEMAAYTDTGVFATKAIREAATFGHVEVVYDGKPSNFRELSKNILVPRTAKYLHLTSNNTIEGTQWHDFSQFFNAGVPLVCDMSSDILSRVMDFNKFDLIYAGAQKNIGAAGVNMVIVNKDILGKVDRKIPSMMDYRQHIDNGSMLNTPPVFAIYVCMLTLRWLKAQGGIPAIEKINEQKAKLIYETIDALPLFIGSVPTEDRSKMNATFTIDNPELEKSFLDICKDNGMVGVKGHRLSGGFRVSMYNAMPMAGVQAITDLMKDFAQKNG
ncbi:MAG: 3-phosphoserine/phosphohydroxythreonine transaminase [Pseudobacter sp.]|uniref:3-phosphoserine/phosphohydroxythreonine transaminase n=1 Tax=Pseudobacter sp. TaxID=2045420 RepID=UPI003F7E1278